MNLAKTVIAESDEPFLMVKLSDTFLGMMEIFKANIINVFPVCMIDQYME